MTTPEQDNSETPQRLLPTRVNMIVQHLAKELDCCRNGTALERDTLFATSGSQLRYLRSILVVLVQSPQEREKGRTMLRKTLRQQDAPAAGTNRTGQLAIQLIRALTPYLETTRRQRALLINSLGHTLYDVHRDVTTMTEPDRETRERKVAFSRQGSPKYPPEFEKALREIYQFAHWKR